MEIKAKDHKYFSMTKKALGTFKESEANLQKNICNYIKTHYPLVRAVSTLNGEKLPVGQAAQVAAIQTHRGIPDLFIYVRKGNYTGLAIELKKEGERLYKRSGEFASEHIAEQAEYLEYLRGEGFKAEFAVGFEQAKQLIDNYLSI